MAARSRTPRCVSPGRVACRGMGAALLVCVFCCRDSPPVARYSNGAPPPASGATPATTRRATTLPALPRTRERAAERHRMVARQIARRGIRNERVLAAMRNVPRHWFVTERNTRRAYDDSPLPIGHGQTISQPYIVALMTELLDLAPGNKVLEIGTGSGYQAAVLAELTDEVYTIEIVEPLARRTVGLFDRRGYHTIHTRIGDGYRGWPDQAPFDAIIVTCAPEEPPPALVEQLAIGGRMCIPVGAQWGDQQLILLRKRPDGTLERRRIEWVRFVPMTGEARERD